MILFNIFKKLVILDGKVMEIDGVFYSLLEILLFLYKNLVFVLIISIGL